MMKSSPGDRICICIKLRKNRNSPLHLKSDIFLLSFMFANNAWVEGRKEKYIEGEKVENRSEKLQSKNRFWTYMKLG